MMQKRRLTLICLIAVFMLPMLGAYFFKKHPSWLGANQTTNYGTWVKAKIIWSKRSNQRPWKLVYWHPNPCDDQCFATLNQLAKIRLAMGRKLYDLDIFLYTNEKNELKSQDLESMQKQDLSLAYANQQQGSIWKSAFSQESIVLVSPENQVLMMYPQDFIAKKMYNDLQRLIKS
jgi:hypothetical protein